jgi:hypothetical protein
LRMRNWRWKNVDLINNANTTTNYRMYYTKFCLKVLYGFGCKE